jgi:transcriptional regulator with XRE-family HTH domain
MDDQRLGATLRAVRIRRRLRQADVAALASVSPMAISRMERGHLDMTSVQVLRKVASQLEVRIFFNGSWRGGDLDRLVNAGHSAIHGAVAALFDRDTGWQLAPEVSFSIYGERGIVDLLAFHAESGTGLVIELKTEIVDVQELVGTLDRNDALGGPSAQNAAGSSRTWECGL